MSSEVQALVKEGRIERVEADRAAAIDARCRYRVSKSRLGAHEATASYATSVLGSGPHGKHAQHLDRMRRNRNRSEYGMWQVGRSTLGADLDHARGILRAVGEQLR